MNIAVQKMTDWLLRIGSVEEHQREWCIYTLEKRLSTFVSLVLLIGIGCLVPPFGIVILLNLGMLYLRPKVNGFHAKTLGVAAIISAFSSGSESFPIIRLPIAAWKPSQII